MPKERSADKSAQTAAKPVAVDSTSVDRLDITALVDDEIVRLRIRKLLEASPSVSIWIRVSTNPLVAVVIGFLLTGLLGGLLTYYYNRKQKELDSQRSLFQLELQREKSFADELNKIRVLRIGEVWEKIFLLEAASNRAYDACGRIWEEGWGVDEKKPLTPYQQQLEQYGVQYRKAMVEACEKERKSIGVVSDEMRDLADKNRFWIGEEGYKQMQAYVDAINSYAKAANNNEISLKEVRERKDRIRASLLDVRNRLIKE